MYTLSGKSRGKTAGTAVVLLLAGALSVSARMSVVVFPLAADGGSRLSRWVGYGFAERFSRKLRMHGEIQVWEPAFLYSVDSTAWRMDSDSLLVAHRRRWEWDVAVGGEYALRGDTVDLALRAVHMVQNVPRRAALEASGTSIFEVTNRLLHDLFDLLQLELSDKGASQIQQQVTSSLRAYRTYAVGYGLEMHGDYAGALSAYSHAVAMDRKLDPAQRRLARLNVLRRNLAAAREGFSRALAASPGNPYLVAAMAEFLVDYDTPEKAAEYVQAVRDVLTETAEGLTAIGKLHLARGEYQRATAMLTRARAAGPMNLDTDFALGKAYLVSGKFDMAIDIFNRLVSYRPDYSRYYSFLGSAYRSAERLMESISILEAAYRIDRDNVSILVNLAHSYFELGWYRKTLQLLVRAREVRPELTEIDVNLGVVYWHMGETDRARKLLAEAVHSASKRQTAINNRANILFLEGRTKKAIRAYRKADKLGGKNETVLYNLGNAYMALGKLKDAEECFEEVLRLAPNRLDVRMELASIKEKRGDIEGAERALRKLLDFAPFDERVVRRLCGVLEKQQKYEAEVKLLEHYLSSFPTSKEFRLLLAETYLHMAWYEVAVMKYEFLVRDFPRDYQARIGLGRAMYGLIVHKGNTDYDKTIYVLKEAAELGPGQAEPDYLIGKIYLEYKNYRDLAREHYNKAMGKARDEAMRKKIREALAGVRP